ncbi:hypothetical protein [Chroococcus sp. FPU101]|uniref:hypothetical protein n=1 Tax=Chroococcus sp. FPU101 TaxID=1974212 RepID=UPI001A9004A8|nr:hypothetical protein [Chroococcus sp. FPU101]GFE69015.1 hypothetical protein CFPU101_16250 [Chroococcus sp. FPU101]
MKNFNQMDKPHSNHSKINFLLIKKNLVTIKIIGLISVVASLILGRVARKDPVSQLNIDLPITKLENCSDILLSVSRSELLKQANIFSPNFVSIRTLRNEFIPVLRCADDLKYDSDSWREASYILNNLPSYEPVSDSLKRALQNSLDDFKSQLSELLINRYMSQFLLGKKPYIELFCSIFLVLNLIYFGMSDLDLAEQNSEHDS